MTLQSASQHQAHSPSADVRFLKFILIAMVAGTLGAGSICTGLAYAQTTHAAIAVASVID